MTGEIRGDITWEDGAEDGAGAFDPDAGDFVANRCGRPPRGERTNRLGVAAGLKSMIIAFTRRKRGSA